MTIFFILLLFVFSFVLIKSAEQVVIALKYIARSTHTGAFAISAILLALATSFPEIFVGITSALEGTPNLSFGNVLGANITNLTLVAGVSAVIVGRVNIHGEFVRREVGIALTAGLLPLILGIDGKVSRVDGLILLVLYVAYATSFFKSRFEQIGRLHLDGELVHRFIQKIEGVNLAGKKSKEIGRLFVGVALLLFSADILVRVAERLALAANLPVFLIGLILISIGTTLPELAFSFRSLKDREPTMFFGNLLGSIITNSTLVVGIASFISPITIVATDKYLIAAAAFVLIFVTFWFFVRSKLRLDRWEAGFLLLLYVVFVVVEFL